MDEKKAPVGGRAQIDFHCLDESCNSVVKFNLADVADREFQAVCQNCYRTYQLDESLRDKFERMLKLIDAVRNAEDILGDTCVAVATATEELRIPYALLLTRLNSMITLQLADKAVDFHLWIEPSSPDTFR